MLALVMVLATAPSIPVEVPLLIEAEMEPEVVEKALAEVAEIFGPGRIELRFALSATRLGAEAPVTVVIAERPARRVIAGCSRNKHDHRLGRTSFPGRRITLWTEQIMRAVHGDWDRAVLAPVSKSVYARALGRVLAHELGHMFLKLSGHRDDGLMRASFSHSTLTARGNRAFRMSDGDLAAVRSLLARTRTKGPPPRRGEVAWKDEPGS